MLRIAGSMMVTAALAFLAGCGGTHELARTEFVEFTPDQQAEIQSRAGDEYRIQEGDILRLAFSYQSELNQDGIVVLSDGSVNLVGIDRVVLGGRTMTEADSMITAAYSREYRDPQVSIIVQETMGRQVYVLGEVRNPGLHKVPSGGIDMLSAVGVAGGFTDDAAAEGSVLVRVTDQGYLAQEVDLRNFSDVSSAGLVMVQIQPYDVIYVPRSRIGDFGYFSRTMLSGLVQITRIAADIKYLTGGSIGRVF